MKRLRVAFLSPDCVATQSNGTTTYLTRIARALQFAGHQTEIFGVSHLVPSSYDFYGIRVHSVRAVDPPLVGWLRARADRYANDGFSTLLRSVVGAWALSQRLEEEERSRGPFDLIHGIDEGLTPLFVRKRRDRRLMCFCQYDRRLWRQTEGETFGLGDRLLALLIRAGIRRADIVYAHSRFLSAHLLSRYGIRAQVFRPPVFMERVPSQHVEVDVPDRYLVHFGLLGRRKGTDLVAAALPLAWRKEPGIRMVWAGTMRTDPAMVMTRYRQLWGPSADSVSWLGPLRKPALYQLVKGAVASVLPSRADNLPNTVSESLVLGVPVIGFRGASLDEMIESGSSGELVPDGDVPALAAAMVRAWRGETRWVGQPAIMADSAPAAAAGKFLRLAGFDDNAIGSDAATPPGTPEPDQFRIKAMHPSSTRLGQGFNVQPDGASVFAIECEQAGPWSTVVCDGQPLETTFGSPGLITAVVPPRLLEHAGAHRVQLADEVRGVSNVVDFVVEP
jgi:glycosyltransferase involved in cell wall biosynthesis